MKPIFFPTQTDFRQWLAENHARETELLVGFYKIGSNKPSMSWPQSVDEALCFGWIDGVRRSVDAERYAIRFTPRKPSDWQNSKMKSSNLQIQLFGGKVNGIIGKREKIKPKGKRFGK